VWFDGERATLTDEGRAAHDAAAQRVEQVRASLADGIEAADWATTMRTLERMARNLGWEPRA
jgi:DNA-binding MarR family transcriptional regulator